MPLLLWPVRYVLAVLKRMTNWAQNFQVFWRIVFWVSVFMVHTKNVRVFAVPASLALFYKRAFFHCFSHGGKSWLPNAFCRFIYAFPGAILSVMRRSAQKLLFAMSATVLFGAFLRHCFVIANGRTVFSFVSSAGNVRKLCGANGAC